MKTKTQHNVSETDLSVSDNAGGFLTFLIKSLMLMANDPENKKFFLPTFLKNLDIGDGKTLVPYKTAIDVGQMQYIQDEVTKSVCGAGWASIHNYPGGYASTIPTLNITSTTINGLNNVKVIGYEIDAPNEQLQYPILFNAKMNAYDAYDKLTFNPATFNFEVTCESNDHKHSEILNPDGTFQAAIKEATLNIVLLVTLNDDLTASVSIPKTYTKPIGGTPLNGISVIFGSEDDGLSISNVEIVPATDVSNFEEKSINQALSNQETTDKIQKILIEKINTDNIRNSLANDIEEQFNKLISNLK